MRSRSRWPLGKNRTRCCIDYAALLKTLCLATARAPPTATFSQARDHSREPIGAIPPVRLHRALRCVAITSIDAVDDQQVLAHGKVKLIDNGTGVQAPIAFGLGLDRAVQRA